MVSIEKVKRGLRNTLLYAQELLNLNEKIVFDVTREPFPFFHSTQFEGLDGIEFNVDAETWVRLERLRETKPPDFSPQHEGWVAQSSRISPDHPPTLLAERIVKLSATEIDVLLDEGAIADIEDIMRPIGSEDEKEPKTLDVILRAKNVPGLLAAWEEYLAGPWNKWAVLEKPRRRCIDLYNKLYQIQQRITSLGEDNPIELVWGIGFVRWKTQQGLINLPILEQLVELELEADGSISVRPRNTSTQLNLRAFHALEVEGSKTLEKDVRSELDRKAEDPDYEFSPFNRGTYEFALRACAARLSASGVYVPDLKEDEQGRELTEILQVDSHWAVFVRQRTEDFRKDDIQRLIRRVDEVQEEDALPPAGARFVQEPSDEQIYGDGIGIDLSRSSLVLPESSRGWSESAGGASAAVRTEDKTFFFPLPYNDDQVEIIRRLEDESTAGVLVQGPPGTGKTHTIANIICHYLATKRRVLVTAKTPEALTALQEKLPEGIRELAIAVIHNDREGNQQLENAVQLLSDQAKQINSDAAQREIAEKQARLADLKRHISELDAQLYTYAEKNLKTVEVSNEQLTPMDLARRVVAASPEFDWFPDEITTEEQFSPQFGDSEVAEIHSLRQTLGSDLLYGLLDVPDLTSLPSQTQILSAHRELSTLQTVEKDRKELPILATDVLPLQQLREIADWLRYFVSLLGRAQETPALIAEYHAMLEQQAIHSAGRAVLLQVIHDWIILADSGRDFYVRDIQVAEADNKDGSLVQALLDLASGKQPFGLFSFLKSGLKSQLDQITLGGVKPSSAADWKLVYGYVLWRRQFATFLPRWASASRALIREPSPSPDITSFLEQGELLAGLRAGAEYAPELVTILRQLFPYGVDAERVVRDGDFGLILSAMSAVLEDEELSDAKALITDLVRLSGGKQLPWHSTVAAVSERLGAPDVKPADLADAWKDIVAEANRLRGTEGLLVRFESLLSLVAGSGAPTLSKLLRSAEPFQFNFSIDTWNGGWQWARYRGFIRSLQDRDRLAALTHRRTALEDEQKRLFVEIVKLRTYLGLKQGMTGRVEAALAKFAAAISRLGKGTGKAAGRYRRIIRDATLDIASTVPCWILPEWRVAEQLPAELSLFHLVVIDEASQSDITSLPAILRGQKVLIVGDDKQVSPSAIGIEERKVVQLRTTFLTGLPFADQIDPSTSLYELGSMVFPGKAIMLREHFRCVEPIIRFSSRFYPKPLIPLRIPRATERLDPPLVDVYLPDGQRNKAKKTNEAEAQYIVDEINRLVSDPAYANRTIGVISLIGEYQAKRIYDLLITEVGVEKIQKHRIMCGDAATYQGQERDIIFLSMVACPNTSVSQTSRVYRQRFNVAMSRARDRLYLIRSVSASDLKPGDLKLDVIEHFRDPMAGGNVVRTGEVLDLCESEFERTFGRELLNLGYRLRPQVPVGDYRIDFVIEGHNDRRLAVELDGDKYHGPEHWSDDMRRQKALERLGWTFWRCWGSNWIGDPHACLQDLISTLNRLGIDPIGSAPLNESYTEHRRVDAATAAVSPGASRAESKDVGSTQSSVVSQQEPPSSAVVATRSPEPKSATDAYSNEGFLDAIQVEIGDLVVIRFDDKPEKPLRVRLSRTENKPEAGVISVTEPLGEALLGASEDDEVEIKVSGRVRVAHIECIEKAAVVRLAS